MAKSFDKTGSLARRGNVDAAQYTQTKQQDLRARSHSVLLLSESISLATSQERNSDRNASL